MWSWAESRIEDYIFPGEVMEKFSLARAVNGWAGRRTRVLVYQHSRQCWASSRVREANWSVAVRTVKLVEQCFEIALKSLPRSEVLEQGRDRACFSVPVMEKGGCKEWQVVEWTCCNFKSPLRNLNLIITVRQNRQQFFMQGCFL